jgi:hypothetical protein
MKQRIIISSEELRRRAIDLIRALPLDQIHEVKISEHKTIRSLEANCKMWAILTDISNQVIWHGHKLTKEEWKDVFSASIKKQKVVPGVDTGGFVVIGAHTSKMSVAEMCDMIEFITAFGCQQGVKWSDYGE